MTQFDKIFTTLQNNLMKMKQSNQEKKDKSRYIGEAGAGMIKVVLDGNATPVSVEVSDLIEPNEEKRCLLTDLFLSAMIKAKQKLDADSNNSPTDDNFDMNSFFSNMMNPKNKE